VVASLVGRVAGTLASKRCCSLASAIASPSKAEEALSIAVDDESRLGSAGLNRADS
jgi:hypothetical protein